MSDKKFGTFEDIIGMTPEPLQAVTKELHELILSLDPQSCVVVRLGDRAATYGIGPKKMSEGYCYIIPHSKWVNLGFYKGTSLDAPEGLLEGTGAKMRHIKIHSLKELKKTQLKKLIQKAVKERKQALGKS